MCRGAHSRGTKPQPCEQRAVELQDKRTDAAPCPHGLLHGASERLKPAKQTHLRLAS